MCRQHSGASARVDDQAIVPARGSDVKKRRIQHEAEEDTVASVTAQKYGVEIPLAGATMIVGTTHGRK